MYAGESAAHGIGVIVSGSGDVASVSNFVEPTRLSVMKEQWDAWKKKSVRSTVNAVLRSDLDDEGQGFYADILEFKAEERERLERAGKLDEYEGLRLFLTGTAGTGKSTTVRAGVHARRQRGVSEGNAVNEDACVLAAPTGCASFQMKYGAATVHRTYGVPCGFCGPTRDQSSDTFMARLNRLRRATMCVFDEFSMIGRQVFGKIVYRTNELLKNHDGLPFKGKDVVLAGDPRQAQPVADEFLFKAGAYAGDKLNRPKKGKASPGSPDMVGLVDQGRLFLASFDDAVILRRVHRIDRDGVAGMSPEEVATYIAEAEEFLEITGEMADCEWTKKQYDVLARRNRSTLRLTPEGRRELAYFDDAPILMDGKTKPKSGADGADQVNLEELKKLSAFKRTPIVSLEALHGYAGDEGDLNPTELDSDDFRGLKSELFLCEAARVLLTHNEWVEAGLMNGALGNVKGFVYKVGGGPAAVDPTKRVPTCVVVEFDDVDLGDDEIDEVDEHGEMRKKRVPRTFFPGLVLGKDASGKERSLKCVPIFRHKVDSSGEEEVYRKQFPLTLAWALTHWKAQGMTLVKARIRLGARTAKTAGIGFVAVTRVKHPRHFVFDDDLPAYADFQEAQHKAGFRQRRRFELRLHAKSSNTLRKYGFCGSDLWAAADRELAIELLDALGAIGKDRALRMGLAADENAWLWPEAPPCLPDLLGLQVERLSRGDLERQAAYQVVAERLLGPLHRPRVEEVLGCLIPPDLHPKWDGKKMRGKADGGVQTTGVVVMARGWKVDVSEQQDILVSRLSKGVLDFFVNVLRKVNEQLKLPILLGPQKLGIDVYAAENPGSLRLKVQD